jgi:outer membrane protein TolC
VRNQEKDYDNLQKLSERNRALAQSGRLSEIDVGQAVQNELRSKNDLLDERAQLELALDEFKLFLGLPIPVQLALDGGVLDELRAQKDEPLSIEEGRATEYALANRLDYMTTMDQEADSVRRAAVAEDALRAVLTATATADLPSQPGKPGKFNFEDLGWRAGLTLNLPFERLPQRNAYRTALINHEVAVRNTALAEDTLRLNLREDLRQASTRRDGYEIQQKAVDLAAQRIESTTMLMDAGRADTRSLLEAQAALLAAQNSATSALIDYTLARLGLFLDMELLRFDAHGIHGEPGLLEAWDGSKGKAARVKEESPGSEANG